MMSIYIITYFVESAVNVLFTPFVNKGFNIFEIKGKVI